MAKHELTAGTTSRIEKLGIIDTNGLDLNGLAYNSPGLVAYYQRDNATPVQITLATATQGTYTSGGFVAIPNMDGGYELHLPNAALAAGATTVSFWVKGVSGMMQSKGEIDLIKFNKQDDVRGGLTALPNAPAGANGGLPLGDASGRVTLTPAQQNAVITGVEVELANDATGQAFLQSVVDRLNAVTDIDELTLTAITTAVRNGILNAVLAGNYDVTGSVGKLLQNAATSAALAVAQTTGVATTTNINDAVASITGALPAAAPSVDTVADAVWNNEERLLSGPVELPSGVAQSGDITALQNSIVQSLTDIGTLLEFLVARNSDWIKEDPETYPGTGTVTYTKAIVPLVYNVAYDANKQVLSVTEAV